MTTEVLPQTFEEIFTLKMNRLHEGLLAKCEPGFFPWLDAERPRQWLITIETFDAGMRDAIRRRDVKLLNRTILDYRTAILHYLTQYNAVAEAV